VSAHERNDTSHHIAALALRDFGERVSRARDAGAVQSITFHHKTGAWPGLSRLQHDDLQLVDR
jgi:hypothetical protein